MGKPYNNELEKLSDTYEWALLEDIDDLKDAVTRFYMMPLITIGSGGSYTAAVFLEKLHSNAGFIAKNITPYEYLTVDHKNIQSGIFLFSASGNNTDALNTLEVSKRVGAQFFISLCMSKNSKLKSFANNTECSKILCHDIPTGKDGFLATNSLFASIVLLLRVYHSLGEYSFEFPSKNDLFYNRKKTFEKFFISAISCKTWIVLYGNWSKAAAVDLESKVVEAGLKNIQLSDYRNFAHGRHHWIAKNTMDTAILAFATPTEEAFAKDILALLPEDIPKTCIVSQEDGPVGALELVLQAYYITSDLGDALNIDPGKPGVPIYGEYIYNMDFMKYHIVDWNDFRYFPSKKNFSPQSKIVKAYEAYKDGISSTKFGAIIFDYDGTLCGASSRFSGISPEISNKLIKLAENGIYIGVATGRGKSVREELQKVIPKELWEYFHIGYYNGGSIAALSNNNEPDKSIPINSALEKISLIIKMDQDLNSFVTLEERPKQITIEVKDKRYSEKVIHYLQELISIENITGVKVVVSSHSIDIIPQGVSKLELVYYLQKGLEKEGSNYQVLCIGDRGRWPGNDCELLSHKYSLSVDEVSDSLESCWNFSSQCNENGSIEYLNKVIIEHNYFTIKL